MDYKVSVIVPMYKASRFIKAAVDGLLNQTLKELEVIVVNDCSPDDSLEICRKLYENNERVQILSQPRNMGPGEARNTGLKAARGEYIAFADIDDGVLKNAYEEMYRLAKDHSDADVIHSTGMILPLDKNDMDNIYDVDSEYYLPISSDRYDIVKEVTVLSDDLNDRYEKWKNHAYHWMVGNKLFRRQFLIENDLHFGEIRLSEDMVFCFSALFSARTYVLTPEKYYLYRISNESISRRGYTTQFFKTACHALFNVCPAVRKTLDKVEYFRNNPKSCDGVIKYMIDILEQEFVIPAYQNLGEETILEDGLFSGLLNEQFGRNADFVKYSFLEQHRKYPPTVSSNSMLNVDALLKYINK
ncbi:MAG: glycosyltransferase [Blautia sp.]|nr:glycosyltransferase [Blautia sp.]